jgi:aminomethyltransferase
MLLDTHRQNELQLADFFGVQYPAYFLNPAVEYQSIARYAGVLDLTHWRIFQVHGRDRVSFLNAMLTADVSSLDVDRGGHALLTTVKGKIIAELFAFVREDDVLLQVSQGDAAEALAVLEKHVVMEDVTIKDVSNDFGVLAIEGSNAEEIMWRLFEKGPFPKEAMQAVARRFNDIDIYITGNSVSGEAGYHLMTPQPSVRPMWDYISQGARGSDGLPVGGIAWNMRRVENGLPWYGVDFTADNFPDECRLGHTVSYDKGCFRGQETLARLHHRGHVNRALVGLVPAGEGSTPQGPSIEGGLASLASLKGLFAEEINNYDEPALAKDARALAATLNLSARYAAQAELFAEGGDGKKPVGHITSAVYSPRLQMPLLLGYLRRETIEANGGVVSTNIRRSSGTAALRRRWRPVVGWSNSSISQCSACRSSAGCVPAGGASRVAPAAASARPYTLSPTIGYPTWCKCTRIWLVRPDCGRASSTVNAGARRTTRKDDTAGLPAVKSTTRFGTNAGKSTRRSLAMPRMVSRAPDIAAAPSLLPIGASTTNVSSATLPCTTAKYDFSTRPCANSFANSRAASRCRLITTSPLVSRSSRCARLT